MFSIIKDCDVRPTVRRFKMPKSNPKVRLCTSLIIISFELSGMLYFSGLEFTLHLGADYEKKKEQLRQELRLRYMEYVGKVRKSSWE